MWIPVTYSAILTVVVLLLMRRIVTLEQTIDWQRDVIDWQIHLALRDKKKPAMLVRKIKSSGVANGKFKVKEVPPSKEGNSTLSVSKADAAVHRSLQS